MAKKQIVKGRNFMLWIDSKTIALSTGCDIQIQANYTDSATKDSGVWNNKELDTVSYSGTCDSLMSPDEKDATLQLIHSALINHVIAGDELPVSFGIPTNASTEGIPDATDWTAPTAGVYTGKCKIISVDIGAPVNGNATLKVSWEGCAKLTPIAPTA
jgi:hypothetical protein